MAWAERISPGKWRGCWRLPDDTKCYTKKSTHPEHPYPTKKLALEAAKEAEVKASRKASIEIGVASASIMWGDYWDTTRKVREDTATEQAEDAIVNKYLRPKWGETPLNGIKQRDVKAWALDLAATQEASYARRIFGVFRASINRAMEQDPPLLDASPCANVRMPKAAKVKKPVKDETALDQLRPFLKQCYQDLVDFGQETGLRPGEMSGLHVAELDLKTGWLTVDKVYVSRRGLVRHSPKDEDAREVPLTAAAIAILKRNIAGRDLNAGCGVPHLHRGRAPRKHCRSPLVFLNAGKPVTADAFWKALQRAAEQAGVTPVKPYDSRHWFITRALEGGLDLVTVAEIVGHSDVKLTQEYTFRTDATRDRLRAALGDRKPLTAVEGQLREETLAAGESGSSATG